MSYKILIIDHDLTSADGIRGQLTAAGYEAVVAESAAEGLKAFDRDRPDLTLIEVQLPKKPGFELCRELKDSCDEGEVRVVLVGDESSLRDVAEIAQSGCDELIQKPVNSERLAEVCEILLGGATGADIDEDIEVDGVADETAIDEPDTEEAVAEVEADEAEVEADEAEGETVAETDDDAVEAEETADEDRTAADAAMLGRSDVNDAMGQLESIVEDRIAGPDDTDSETVDTATPISAAEAAGDFSHILMETEGAMNRDRPEQEACEPTVSEPAREETVADRLDLLSGVEEGDDIEAHLDSLFSGTSPTVSPPPVQPVIPRSVEPTPAEPVNVAAETEEVTSSKTENLVVWENLDTPTGDASAPEPQATVTAPDPSLRDSPPVVVPAQFSSSSQTARIDEPIVPRAQDEPGEGDTPTAAPGDTVGFAPPIHSTDTQAPASGGRRFVWIAAAAVVVIAVGAGLWLMRPPGPEPTVQSSVTPTPAGDSRVIASSPVTSTSADNSDPFAGVPATAVEDPEMPVSSSATAPGAGKPVAAAKPTTPTTKPVATAKPTTTTAKPVATAKPTTTTAKPVATAKPTTTTAKPVATAKPTTTATKPVATAKPTTTATKPVATAKPTTTTTKPVATAKPTTTTTKPVATAKPTTTTTKPVATAKPITTTAKPVAEPITSSAPAVATKPAATAPEPAAAVAKPEPEVTAPSPSSATQPPEPAPAEIGLKPPVVLERVEPTYPPKALKRGGGTVVLSVLVNEKGGISRVVVEEGLSGSELEAAAIGAVLSWRYQPATENGKPVRAWATARFVFEP